ncbi:MAG: hypothetical protein N2319_12085 [Candidatus Kapabacteria bacterium]|nr:hypothetical protein [Candidatus Kapabacteria bacterium]
MNQSILDSLKSVRDITDISPDITNSIRQQMELVINSANIIAQNFNKNVLDGLTENLKYFQQQQSEIFNKTFLSSLHLNIDSAIKSIDFSGVNHFQEMISTSFANLNLNMNNIFQGYVNTLVESLNNSNSYLSQILKEVDNSNKVEKAKEVQDLLIKEYGFMFFDLSTEQLLKIRNYPLKIRNATVTKILYSNTKKELYSEMMLNSFDDNKRLKKRKTVILQGYHAHCRGEFYLSIPVFLAQIEGMVADFLVLSKICERNDHLLTKKGLEKKIKKTGIENKEDFLMNIYNRITNFIVSERNAIMHGNKVNYSSAKLSTELLLILLYLTTLFHSKVRYENY